MKLEVGKTYFTRGRSKVKIVAIDMDARSCYNQAIGWLQGASASWRIDGIYCTTGPSTYDILAEAPTEGLVERIPALGHPLVVDDATRLCRPATQDDIHKFERIALKYKRLLLTLREAIGDE